MSPQVGRLAQSISQSFVQPGRLSNSSHDEQIIKVPAEQVDPRGGTGIDGCLSYPTYCRFGPRPSPPSRLFNLRGGENGDEIANGNHGSEKRPSGSGMIEADEELEHMVR